VPTAFIANPSAAPASSGGRSLGGSIIISSELRPATRTILNARENRLLIKCPAASITKPDLANVQEGDQCDHRNCKKEDLHVVAAHVGNKAAEDDTGDKDKRWKYSPLERRVSAEVEEKKTENGQYSPNDHERDENLVSVGNPRLGQDWSRRCHGSLPPNDERSHAGPMTLSKQQHVLPAWAGGIGWVFR